MCIDSRCSCFCNQINQNFGKIGAAILDNASFTLKMLEMTSEQEAEWEKTCPACKHPRAS